MAHFKRKATLFGSSADKRRKTAKHNAAMNPPVSYQAPSQDPMSPPIDDVPEHVSLGRPGRLAPKWIQDLLAGKLDESLENRTLLGIGCAASAGDALDGVPEQHELLISGHQTSGRQVVVDSSSVHEDTVSCVCRHCGYHFVLIVTAPVDGKICSVTNLSDYFHHLVWQQTMAVPLPAEPKYYPVLGRLQYQCSARECRLKVFVDVSEPRLRPKFLDYLQDRKRIMQRYKAAVQEEPERYTDMKNASPGALLLLLIYIRNVVQGNHLEKKTDGSESERKIDKRNKRFYIQFGDDQDCIDLFRYLDFEEVHIGESSMWKVPAPEIVRPTPIGSRLAFFQDIESEIENVLTRTESTDMVPLRPALAISHLKKALHIGEHYAQTKVTGQHYDAGDFDILGITPDLHESVLWYAFGCQRQTDPLSESNYFDALQRLARGRGNEELEMKVQSYDSMRTLPPPALDDEEELRRAKEMSLRDAGYHHGSDLTAALLYFGFAALPETSDLMIGKFLALCDASPAQKSTHREKLLVIGRAINNKRLMDVAQDTMDLDEAVKYLGVDKDTEPDFVISTAQWQASKEGGRDYLLVATALLVIGKSRANSSIFMNAGAIIKAEHEQSYESGLEAPDQMQDLPPSNMDLPAGLGNIRNTCYLNSILQYLFTVRKMREIVLDWDQYGLENSEENLMARRIDPGSTRVERGEAFAGQQFATELGGLFSELQTTDRPFIKPTQRLALAALKNSKQLEEDGAKILLRPEADAPLSFISKDLPPTPPPLPARPPPAAPAPPVPPHDAHGLEATADAVPDLDVIEILSTASDPLPVSQAGDGPGHSEVTVNGQHGAEGPPMPPPQSQTEQGRPSSAEGSDLPDLLMDDIGPGVSSAMELDASGDVVMNGSSSAPEATVEQKIAKALDDSSVSGTDQQDVEEVMGNIIGHLRAAIKATGEDVEINAQTDPVMDLFFWTSASYSRKRGERAFRRTLNTNRWVTAFPDEGGATIGLMQALDRNFQRELIKEDEATYERFSSVVKLPPILHIHIQRTTRDGGKNMAPIEIPEALYLDRFMDGPAGGDLFKKRQRGWDLSERLRSLKGTDGGGELQMPHMDDPELDIVKDYNKCVIDQFMNDDTPEGVEDDGFTIINDELTALFEAHDITPPHTPPAQDEDMGVTRQTLKEALNPAVAEAFAKRSEDSEEAYRRELEELFADMQKEKYRLHAVICHAGQTGRSGHYWVWIFDFEKDVWRKYNDSDVTEQANTGEVMQTLSSRGEPYYLAYVRDDAVSAMVDIPYRVPAQPAPEHSSH